MKNTINLVFVGIFFICPFIYAWYYPNHTAGAVAIGFLIAGLLIADWYHLHIMKTYRNCLLWLIGCAFLSAILFATFKYIYGFNPFLHPEQITHKQASRILFRVLVISLGLASISIVNLPRIGLLKIMKVET